MNIKEFNELLFNTTPDLTPYFIHLTKEPDGRSAFKNLLSILKDGESFENLTLALEITKLFLDQTMSRNNPH